MSNEQTSDANQSNLPLAEADARVVEAERALEAAKARRDMARARAGGFRGDPIGTGPNPGPGVRTDGSLPGPIRTGPGVGPGVRIDTSPSGLRSRFEEATPPEFRPRAAPAVVAPDTADPHDFHKNPHATGGGKA